MNDSGVIRMKILKMVLPFPLTTTSSSFKPGQRVGLFHQLAFRQQQDYRRTREPLPIYVEHVHCNVLRYTTSYKTPRHDVYSHVLIMEYKNRHAKLDRDTGYKNFNRISVMRLKLDICIVKLYCTGNDVLKRGLED